MLHEFRGFSNGCLVDTVPDRNKKKKETPFPMICRDKTTGHKLTTETALLPKWWLLSSTWECCHHIPTTWSHKRKLLFFFSFHFLCLYLPVIPVQPSWSLGGVRTCPFSLFLSVTCYSRCLLWIVSVKSDKHSAVVIYIRETAMCRTELSSVDDLYFEGAGRRGQGPNFTYSISPWLGGTVNNLERESITVLIYQRSVGSFLRSSAMCPHCSFKCFDNRITNNLPHFSKVKPCKLLNCGCINVAMLVTDPPL